MCPIPCVVIATSPSLSVVPAEADRTITAVTSPLTPVQQRTLDLLRRTGDPVEFDAEFVAALRADLHAGLTELEDRLEPDDTLWVSKHHIDRVLTCEASWAAPDAFEWTPANARGKIAHRAIQLSVHWPGDTDPMSLVSEAVSRMESEERGLSDWLAGLGPADVADLRGRSVEHVTKFLECFPRLEAAWIPVTESRMQYPREGRIVLSARVDLTLGKTVGRESRKVIVDVKTGRIHSRHREDLRFYALLETLTRDIPPRLLVTYSLDSGSADREETTTALLRSTLRRTLDAIERMVEVRHEEREPKRVPTVACRWCTLRESCDPGRAWLAGATAPADDDDGFV
jgi:CRISPR/Cas system-associated exonuclease Cas4 (RecB family)